MINNMRWLGVLGAVYAAVAAPGAALALPGEAPAWLQALSARSTSLNREYGLGADAGAREGARSSSASDWLVALNARSNALNHTYGLGDARSRKG
jgi:hypothetical protein